MSPALALAALDPEHLWLPDAVTLPGIAAGLGRFNLVRCATTGRDRAIQLVTDLPAPESQPLRCLLAAGLILLIRWTYWLVRRREGIGLGDAKLMAMLAVWLGLPGAMLAFAIGVLLGAVVGSRFFCPRLRRSDDPHRPDRSYPSAHSFALAESSAALWGRPILAAYLRWSGLSTDADSLLLGLRSGAALDGNGFGVRPSQAP